MSLRCEMSMAKLINHQQRSEFWIWGFLHYIPHVAFTWEPGCTQACLMTTYIVVSTRVVYGSHHSIGRRLTLFVCFCPAALSWIMQFASCLCIWSNDLVDLIAHYSYTYSDDMFNRNEAPPMAVLVHTRGSIPEIIRENHHASVVWNWYHWVAIAYLYQPSP